MATTLQQAIDLVRGRHPAFDPRLVPDKVLADFWTLEQRNVLTQALLRDRQYVAQSLPIAFDIANASLDAPGTAGSGTQGGVPAMSDGHGGFSYVQATTGSGVDVETDGVVVLVSDTSIVSATSTTLTGLAVAWTTNAYANDIVIITAGTGANQPPRTILSNTATALTISAAWAIQPDVTSLFQVVQATNIVDQTFGVVIDLPSVNTNVGYLVRLNTQGIPYIDTTKPLTVNTDRGVPLPPFQSILGGTVRLIPDAGDIQAQWPTTAPLTLGSYADRFRPLGDFNAYVMNGMLMLCGVRRDWSQVQGIELSYVPIPPPLLARTDYFLLPDTALPLLVAKAVVFAAARLQGLEDVPDVPMDAFIAAETAATRDFFGTLQLTRTARVSRMRRGRY